ncbi:MAG: GTP cyclohydrolase 1 type 2 [Isosphaeraceae bacterium]|jgi:dinuclear metal center YbgI/SA1388 family protein|nr:MAG: GTP cyclohydrolase 1 type 2 [Isosphaeraceae bacterium]
MKTVGDVAAWLESIAPIRLAESWDNVGLLMGDPAVECPRVMTCLTLTRRVAEEAIAGEATLVVAHHPILFRPVQRLRADWSETEAVWMLARAGVAVYSAHTAYDNAPGGINDQLAERLGLEQVGPLQERPGAAAYKVVVFCPREVREGVLAAAFEAGAGRIGAYTECSYSGVGVGTFRGDETSKPAIGQAGRRETVREWRVELLCEQAALAAVVEAIRRAHCYEEPAIDVYPLHPGEVRAGVGRLGRLSEPLTLAELARRVGERLKARRVDYAGDPERHVERLAIVCGAGDELIAAAAQRGADAFVTGEARYHRALAAESLGLGLILAGHDATERPAMEVLAARLARELDGVASWASRVEADPLRSA